EPRWRRITVSALGIVGVALAAIGLIGGSIFPAFLVSGDLLPGQSINGPYGLFLSLLGLGYLWAFLGMRGTTDDLGYRAGLSLGIVGVIVFVVALIVSLAKSQVLVQSGLLLMGLGLLYVVVSAGICSDNRVIVLTRRELTAFFYSPIAYIVMVCLTLVAGLLFY